ncbi:hypothetical protein KR067_001159, partial [Drosophila pandora]
HSPASHLSIMTDKVPEWLTAEVFEDVLRRNVDGFVKVRSFKPELGSAASDNSATIMLRAKIEVELKGFAVAAGGMASVLMDPTEDSSLDNCMESGSEGVDFQLQMFQNPRYRKHIEVVLPWLLNRGALEI